jgi:two-component system sensor histidine kinase KdpD
MPISARQNWVGYFIVLCGLAFVTVLYREILPGVNGTTVALSFLLVVLAAASAYGLGPAIAASMIGMLCLNFFFLPPFGTLTIHDPQNWVALFAFLVTAVTASQLSSAARARARDAEKRREEVSKLYELSRTIIATPDSETAVSSIARQVVEVFGFDYCAVFTPDEAGRWRRLALASELSFTPTENEIANVYLAGEMKLLDRAEGSGSANRQAETRLNVAYAPLKVGIKSIGVMISVSSTIERGTLEAIAGLVALALERARFLKAISHTEALRQSDELKSALLASVSHDLRTPLTSIRASVDSLLQEEIEWDKKALREFHLIISEEVERLTRLIRNLLEMARIEAGEMRPSKQWGSISEIFGNVLDRTAAATQNHKVIVDLDDGLPLVKIDPRLIAEALTNLVENAVRYSPHGSEIIIRGRIQEENMIVSVTDQGEGIDPDERERVFDKFYRSTRLNKQYKEGTGMGLAIARGIVESHGGRIWVESASGHGLEFSFMVPVELKSAKATASAAEDD